MGIKALALVSVTIVVMLFSTSTYANPTVPTGLNFEVSKCKNI